MQMKLPTIKGLRIRCRLFRVLSVLLAVLSAVNAQVPPGVKPVPAPPTVHSLRVIPLAGDGEVNDLERRIMAPLVVQVLDQNGRPVEGAEVKFQFPLGGPSATFPNQQTSQTGKTNADGQAAALGWMANGQAGRFPVRVTASRGNEAGEVTITMTNSIRVVEAKKDDRKRWWSSRWVKIGIVAGVAAGVTTGIILATRDNSRPTITISPGSPTIGGGIQ